MKKTLNNLFVVAAFAGTFFMACSGGSDSEGVAGGAVVDSGLALENVTISGVSQKGPFLKGSNVMVFELDGTNELRQTGRSFGGTVKSDDGSFKIKNVSLASSYVYLTVTGSYRLEQSKGYSAASITLRALSDLNDERTSVNLNLVTHLEYDRVVYLLENNPKMKLSEAKKQAEKEIFAMFGIDSDDFGYSEELDILGKGDADAALLAVSVMLGSLIPVVEHLTSMGDDMAEDGTCDDEAILDTIALKAMKMDLGGKLPNVRENILSWGISEDVPAFEKYVRAFWQNRFGLGECGGTDTPVGTVKGLLKGETDVNAYYTCVDSSDVGKVWRIADDIEKDTYEGNPGEDSPGDEIEKDTPDDGEHAEGEMIAGRINKDRLYVFDNGVFRNANDLEIYLNKGCTEGIEGTVFKYMHSAFVCKGGQWEFDSENTEKGTVKDSHDDHVYKTIGIGNQVWMAENVKHHFDLDLFCFQKDLEYCETYGAEMTIYEALDGIYIDPNSEEFENPPPGMSGGITLANFELKEEHQGVCPDGFHLPSRREFQELFDFVDKFNGDESVAQSLNSKTGWPEDGFAGTDRFGFNLLPAGWEKWEAENHIVQSDGVEALFWVKPEDKKHIHYDMAYLKIDSGSMSFETSMSGPGVDMFYVRCVKNAEE